MVTDDAPSRTRHDEGARLAIVEALHLLDVEADAPLLGLCSIAERAMQVDVASVSIVGRDLVRLILRPDWPTRELPRAISFAALVVEEDGPVVIEDIRRDPRMQHLARFDARFIAGWPIRAPAGEVLASFTVVASQPRTVDERDLATLRQCAMIAANLLRVRALESLRGRGANHADPREIAARAQDEPALLAFAAGAPLPAAPVALAPEDARWASFDPTLMQLLARKRTVEILRELHDVGTLRFTQLLRAIPGMNSRTLTTRLHELQAAGLVARIQYEEVPVRVEYRLADAARPLVERWLQALARGP